jgi:transposase InsO family protein
MIRELVAQAEAAGARRARACAVIGLSLRTVERWKHADDDRRSGPRRVPRNALTATERQRVVAVATSPEMRDLSPKQIVPRLADRGVYVASESTFYRVLRAEQLDERRGRMRAPCGATRPREHVATAPWQVASWDITFLRSHVRGAFFHLYMVEDVWSRKILAWDVHDVESMEHAAALVERLHREAASTGIDLRGWVLHADNGGPMKGSTMLATMQRLGVVPSFSRPSVSDDNPFSEALFRTLKYCPEYPRHGFATVDAARAWVAGFVTWYNHEHLHSGIGFVTPAARHAGDDVAQLAQRRRIYERARRRRPERWARGTRSWQRPATVYLNPEEPAAVEQQAT